MWHAALALAGAGAVTAAASAEFIGLIAEDATDPGAQKLGLRVWNVYAAFDDPADRLVAVAGEAANESILVIETDDPEGFFQHPFGGDLAPTAVFVELFPDLAYDTFVTIGVKVDDGTDQTYLLVFWPGFDASSLVVDKSGWAVFPDSEQAVAGPDGRVLMGQFTVGQGYCVTGEGIELVWSNAEGAQFFLTNQSFDCLLAPVGDLDGDGSVGSADLLILLAAWGPCADCGNCPADLDGNCTVSTTDLLILLANWG